MKYREVVITGMGCTTAEASSPDALFDQILSGRSSIKIDETLRTLGLPNPISASISQAIWDVVDAQVQAEGTRHTRLSLFTAGQAIAQSGILGNDHDRAGIFMASNRSPTDFVDLMQAAGAIDKSGECVSLDTLWQSIKAQDGRSSRSRRDLSAMAIAGRFCPSGMVMTSNDACAAGGISIGTAYRYIRHGLLDLAIAGGTELACEPLSFLCFSSTGMTYSSLSQDPAAACRPFDRDRRGMVLGEGSAFLVMEDAEHARARGSRPLARIRGFAKYAEAGNVLSSNEEGTEFARCMKAALDDAGLDVRDIDHINAHGTATISNDACESRAIDLVFGKHAADIPVTANKSFIGHTIGASAVIESILSVLSLQKGVLLPTLNYGNPDPSLPPLDIVTAPRDKKNLRTILSNSFAMGGENCSLVLEAV